MSLSHSPSGSSSHRGSKLRKLGGAIALSSGLMLGSNIAQAQNSPPVQQVITKTAEQIAEHCRVSPEFMEKFGGKDICVSMDHGNTWSPLQKGLSAAGVLALIAAGAIFAYRKMRKPTKKDVPVLKDLGKKPSKNTSFVDRLKALIPKTQKQKNEIARLESIENTKKALKKILYPAGIDAAWEKGLFDDLSACTNIHERLFRFTIDAVGEISVSDSTIEGHTVYLQNDSTWGPSVQNISIEAIESMLASQKPTSESIKSVNSGSSIVSSDDSADSYMSVEPVGEAEIYISYGRYPQAEQILIDAYRENPDRVNILLKLLEVYILQNNEVLAKDLAKKILSHPNLTEQNREKVYSLMPIEAEGNPEIVSIKDPITTHSYSYTPGHISNFTGTKFDGFYEGSEQLAIVYSAGGKPFMQDYIHSSKTADGQVLMIALDGVSQGIGDTERFVREIGGALEDYSLTEVIAGNGCDIKNFDRVGTTVGKVVVQGDILTFEKFGDIGILIFDIKGNIVYKNISGGFIPDNWFGSTDIVDPEEGKKILKNITDYGFGRDISLEDAITKGEFMKRYGLYTKQINPDTAHIDVVTQTCTLRDGYMVVLATDGVFDNLSTEAIINSIQLNSYDSKKSAGYILGSLDRQHTINCNSYGEEYKEDNIGLTLYHHTSKAIPTPTKSLEQVDLDLDLNGFGDVPTRPDILAETLAPITGASQEGKTPNRFQNNIIPTTSTPLSYGTTDMNYSVPNYDYSSHVNMNHYKVAPISVKYNFSNVVPGNKTTDTQVETPVTSPVQETTIPVIEVEDQKSNLPTGETHEQDAPSVVVENVVEMTPDTTTETPKLVAGILEGNNKNKASWGRRLVESINGRGPTPKGPKMKSPGDLLSDQEGLTQKIKRYNPNVGEVGNTIVDQYKQRRIEERRIKIAGYNTQLDEIFAPTATQVRGKNISVSLGNDFIVTRNGLMNFDILVCQTNEKYSGLKSREEVKTKIASL